MSRVARPGAQTDERDAPASTGRRWLSVLKAALGIALVGGLLLWQDNGRKLLEIFAGFRIQYAFGLLLVALVLNAASSVKWRLFVRDSGVEVSQFKLFKLYLIGKFFNNFLPSMIGGDLARIYLLGRWVKSHTISAASVGLERASGIIGLTILALVFVAFDIRLLGNPIIALALGGATAACAAMIAMFYWPDFAAGMIVFIRALPGLGRLAAKVDRLLQEVSYFRTHHRVLLLSLVYSFAFHLLAGINVYVACLSIGLTPPLLSILVITPIILLVTMVPVSPNNIGWWEWCFSVLLLDAGATAAQGLAVAVTLRAVTLLISLVGGLLFLLDRSARSPQ